MLLAFAMLQYTAKLLLSCRVYGLVLWDYPLSDPRVLQWRHWRRKSAPSDCDPHMINTHGHLKPDRDSTAALDFVKHYEQSTWQKLEVKLFFKCFPRCQCQACVQSGWNSLYLATQLGHMSTWVANTSLPNILNANTNDNVVLVSFTNGCEVLFYLRIRQYPKCL